MKLQDILQNYFRSKFVRMAVKFRKLVIFRRYF